MIILIVVKSEGAKVVNKRSMTLLSLLKKTLKRGLKFQEERYLSSDTVYPKVVSNSFMVKAKCRTSMSTREIHDLEVSLDLTCTCKAGNSGYVL